MSGIELLELMDRDGLALLSIVITGRGDVPTAVTAMRAGALDYVQKPMDSMELLALIDRTFTRSIAAGIERMLHDDASVKMSSLTPRLHQIMLLMLAGHPSKNIAADLGISRRTVEKHRASIMKRTGSGSLPALARLAMSGGPRRCDLHLICTLAREAWPSRVRR
jgi:two-component system CheB/CheR fusion protein